MINEILKKANFIIDEKKQILYLKTNPSVIKNIYNPSEKQQVLAVKNYPKNIKYIFRPTLETQNIVLRKDYTLVKYISNIHSNLDLTEECIAYLQSTKQVVLESEKTKLINMGIKNPEIVNWLDFLSEEDCIKLVSKNWRALKYIKNPPFQCIIQAIKTNKHALIFTDLHNLSSDNLTIIKDLL